MNRNPLFVLIHSPLVGPLTWTPVAGEMRQRGLDVLVPRLEDTPNSRDPFWKQHAVAVARSMRDVSESLNLILVAHSGTGPLLPVIRQSVPNPVDAYVFVDAGIPKDGATRLDLMKSEDPAWAAQFQQEMESGEQFPTWSFDDLQEVIPDHTLRRQMMAELHPRGLDFFNEPIPVFAGWPDAPCVYIQFSPMYQKPAAHARQKGWLTEEVAGGHFHMLVDPAVVTDRIIETVNKAIAK